MYEKSSYCLDRGFVLELAQTATAEIMREREAFQLEARDKNLALKGKINAVRIETENIALFIADAKKLAEKIKNQPQLLKIDQLYRYMIIPHHLT